MKSTTGSSNIFAIVLEKLRSTNSQRTTVFEDSQADTPARNRASCRQHQQTSELAKLCREAIRGDLEERRAAVMDEAAVAGRSIRKAQRSFANYKTKACVSRSASYRGERLSSRAQQKETLCAGSIQE
ncbi:hypothetical protein V3C99_018550 [Haemonchus contortus]|uniref:Uncharacterized protein n=1 Tax=Haemonchus contortus TaxID=6289 RepID=A0A7I4Z0V0_HAECO